jgi:dTDP-4-dehydrorhamnose reductase
MIKTAIIGASGYIGKHLWQSYRHAFPDCLGTGFSSCAPEFTPFDIRTPNLLPLRLEDSGHQAVLITSAKSNINYCTHEKDAAYAVNVAGTLEFIRLIGRTSLALIFLSTDYVFQGTTGGYDDNAPTGPTTEYGRQKAQVEKEIPSLVDNYLILRPSKVYGIQKQDRTLLDEMAQSFVDGKPIQAAADQYFCPTLVTDLVHAVHAIQARSLHGVLNVCSPERWSRYEIGVALAAAMNLSADRLVKRVNLDDIPTMKGRPLNTSMVCSRLQKETTCSFTPLRASIDHVAANWRPAASVAA